VFICPAARRGTSVGPAAYSNPTSQKDYGINGGIQSGGCCAERSTSKSSEGVGWLGSAGCDVSPGAEGAAGLEGAAGAVCSGAAEAVPLPMRAIDPTAAKTAKARATSLLFDTDSSTGAARHTYRRVVRSRSCSIHVFHVSPGRSPPGWPVHWAAGAAVVPRVEPAPVSASST